MGRQVVHFAMGLAIPIGILQLIGTFFLPLHTVSFYITLVNMGSIKLRATGGVAEIGDLCKLILAIKPDFAFCNEVRGGHDLMDLQQRFCVDTVNLFFKNSCPGFSCAYALGVAIVIMVITNFCLQGTAVWMLYHYMYNTPKKQFREVSLILVIVGAAVVTICLGLYLPLVSMQLDSIEVIGINKFVNVSPGTGISIGYWILWVSVIVEIVQIILFKNSKISDERRRIEAKMQEQFEAELAIGGYGEYGDGYGTDPYGGGGYDPYGMPQQPYAQQSPPSWGVTPQANPYGMQPAPPYGGGYGGGYGGY